VIRRRILAATVTMTLSGLCFVLLARAGMPQSSGAVSDVDPHTAFGSKTAPVVMEIFSDFQCPACKTLYTATNNKLMDNYVNVGKVYPVSYTHLTLPTICSV